MWGGVVLEMFEVISGSIWEEVGRFAEDIFLGKFLEVVRKCQGK